MFVIKIRENTNMSKFYLLVFLFCFSLGVCSQTRELKKFRVMFYNCENFFDCIDDSLTNDEEFLPGNIRGWNYDKYQKKQNNIARVITNIGEWDAPAIVGLCEVESDKCLYDLTRNSGLKNLKYRFVHFESPDPRGIDVALLYQPSVFKILEKKSLRINFPEGLTGKTRDILYVNGIVSSCDTLHVFVCHFPSRLGGELESEEKRVFVASFLKSKTDSIFSTDKNANILIMGDFNDYPDNKSMKEVLSAHKPENVKPENLYNMMMPLMNGNRGTHKIDGDWGILDQIIVSGHLFDMKSGLKVLQNSAVIFDAPFLLVKDDKFLGDKPFRTYNGMKYTEGYSDHLPVYIDFWY
jgi:predicted extracellular nuclease